MEICDREVTRTKYLPQRKPCSPFAAAPDVSALVNTALAPEKVKFEEKIGKCTEKVPKDANAYHVCIIQQTFAGLQDLGKSGAFTLLAGVC